MKNKTLNNIKKGYETIVKEEEKMKKTAFDKVGKTITEFNKHIDKIELDVFKSNNIEYEYIVVTFSNSAISVRNASYNSLNANIRELGSMLDGGYYKEVETYIGLKKEGVKNE